MRVGNKSYIVIKRATQAIVLIVAIAIIVIVGEIYRFQHAHYKAQVLAQERTNENLPRVTIENSNTVYCRMRECDFRFPLPAGARVQSMNPPTGGFDTIRGTIYVTTARGGPIDVGDYATMLRRHDFKVDPGFASEVKMGYLASLSASTEDGGFVGTEVVSNSTRIVFSYFGDL